MAHSALFGSSSVKSSQVVAMSWGRWRWALCQPLLALLILRFLRSELVPLGVGALLALCALLALLCLFQALLALLHLFGRSGNSQYLV